MSFNLDAAFPSKNVKAADLGEEQDWTVTVASVELAEVDKNVIKPRLRFKGWKQGLILNQINKNTIKKLLGIDKQAPLPSDKLEGFSFTLYTTETEMNSEMVPCVRIRSKLPTADQIKESANQIPESSRPLVATEGMDV